jgi:hypothetical protein
MAKPKALTFAQAMKLMRSSDPETQERGFGQIEARAAEHLDDLLAAFATERDHGLRCWLLELIGVARSERAFPVLQEALEGSDDSLRTWAVHGLAALDTKAARTLLWDAEQSESNSTEETAEIRRVLAELRAARKYP